MEIKLTTKESEFQKWFPEISPKLWGHFKLHRIVIETKQGVTFEWNPMAPREGHYKVHVEWAGKNFDEMRNRLYPIVRATMYGNFADILTDNVEELLNEIKEVYPNSTLLKYVYDGYWPKGDGYRISVRD